MRKQAFPWRALWLAWLFVPGCLWLEITTEHDYRAPAPRADDQLTDDRLDDRPAPAFDAALVDRRLLGEWRLNASAACGYSASAPRMVRISAVYTEGFSLRSTSGRNIGFMPGPRLRSSVIIGSLSIGETSGC